MELVHYGFAVLLGAHGAQQLEMSWQHCTGGLLAELPFGDSEVSWNTWDSASLHPLLVRDGARILVGGVLIMAPSMAQGAHCTVIRVLCSPKMLESAHVKARILNVLREHGLYLLATRLGTQTSQLWDLPGSDISRDHFSRVGEVGSDLMIMKPNGKEPQVCECSYCTVTSLPLSSSASA